jgi:hypothetical protein
MENTLKEYYCIWKIGQEYFAAYEEYADPHKIEPTVSRRIFNISQNIVYPTVHHLP